MKEVKASIYCSECGYQNIVASPIEGMEVMCSKCKRSIILRKKAEPSDSKRIPAAVGSLKTDSTIIPKVPVSKEQNLVTANLKMMARLEELENQIYNLQSENKDLQNKLTTEMVGLREVQAKKESEFPGKNLLEAILLEVKDQKAGQELAQALQRKDADTLYRTINAMMMEIYEIKKEIAKIGENASV
jgi:hypothetical protein